MSPPSPPHTHTRREKKQFIIQKKVVPFLSHFCNYYMTQKSLFADILSEQTGLLSAENLHACYHNYSPRLAVNAWIGLIIAIADISLPLLIAVLLERPSFLEWSSIFHIAPIILRSCFQLIGKKRRRNSVINTSVNDISTLTCFNSLPQEQGKNAKYVGS